MKQSIIYSSILIFAVSSLSTGAYTQHNIQSANFIAQKWIINNNSFTPSRYNLDDNITRREMLKILMNLSGKEVVDRCLWAFQDISSDDWGCKYAEAAVKEWFIAQNTNFRPDDLLTQIEALKMIMQWIGVERDQADDWRDWYKTKAESLWIIDDTYLDYNKSAIRGWIFSNTARSFDEFEFVETSSWDFDDSELPDDVKELFDSIYVDYDI